MLCGAVGAKLMQTRKNVHPFASTNPVQVAKASALVGRFIGNISYEIDCDMLEEGVVLHLDCRYYTCLQYGFLKLKEQHMSEEIPCTLHQMAKDTNTSAVLKIWVHAYLLCDN